MEKTGKVWLVGAGPSDIGLLTLKARQLIDEAEVIVYDALVGDAVLASLPHTAELIHAGKRASCHLLPQEEINAILCQKAKEGKRVVRLKGGDPFLFGRGGEEIECLQKEHIPYEVVPGVTSAVSVPAYQGIPVTHRDFVSSLHIITGHKKKGEPYDLPFEAYVKTGGTLVFLMGRSALDDIVKGLLAAGMDPEMPAALLESGTTAAQRRVVSTLEQITHDAEAEQIGTPAIIVVGKVCALAQSFSWYEKLPLAGCKMYVTRPKERGSALAGKLRAFGAEVIELPSIETAARTVNEEIRSVYGQLGSYQYILFTSPFGVRTFFSQLMETGIDIRSIGNAKIGAIGSATASELKKHGLLADYVPDIYSGQELGKLIGESCKDGDRILLARAAAGGADVVREITNRKQVTLTDLAIYDTNPAPKGALRLKQEDLSKDGHSVFFTSASTVKGFVQQAAGLDLNGVTAFCIGEQTAAAAKKYGMHTVVSEQATLDSLVERAISWNKNRGV
jgi:uroporphyrinogen III methyltransferase/synthase